ncbi:YbdD/YjiX family protein [Streptomyces sp. 7-21]|jgi:uncharacterized short protein YbdD (DUF466 family)|uniref:CstA-like transporter-associated (seleno)protein n=1 Tax=Streptomyces sp. 7-21 TaxID=2802283 RepID=UPI00191D4E71|nr:YbdD/YjiX family protein [Streptomyces sp. 7-21]MBL1065081.1 YbdD/YjiX family protein [Streptomyces sp. 7-21]
MTAVRRRLARLWWYVREFTGETAYERYVERARTQDPHAPVLSRREFERRRVAERYGDGAAPRRGCC